MGIISGAGIHNTALTAKRSIATIRDSVAEYYFHTESIAAMDHRKPIATYLPATRI